LASAATKNILLRQHQEACVLMKEVFVEVGGVHIKVVLPVCLSLSLYLSISLSDLIKE
jgi:hypothetical protein